MIVLTPTEKRVLELIVKGYTNAGIAEIIGISEKTVNTHRSNVWQKAGGGTVDEFVSGGVCVYLAHG